MGEGASKVKGAGTDCSNPLRSRIAPLRSSFHICDLLWKASPQVLLMDASPKQAQP